MGSVLVAFIMVKILADTTKYFDYHGLSGQPKIGAGIIVGTAFNMYVPSFSNTLTSPYYASLTGLIV